MRYELFDGPDTNSPLIGEPFSGTNLPFPVSSNGCVIINFISDNNVALEGFDLYWEAIISPPINPIISLPNPPSYSTNGHKTESAFWKYIKIEAKDSIKSITKLYGNK